MEHDSIFFAFGLMKQNCIRHLVVTDRESRLVGILSDRDILKGLSEVSNMDREMPKVEAYMSRMPSCCRPQDDLKVAIHKMLDSDFHCIPVVGENGQAEGIVTSKDVLSLVDRGIYRLAKPALSSDAQLQT